MALASDSFTLEDLEQFEGSPGRHELLDGALLVTPAASSQHQSVSVPLASELFKYASRSNLGAVFAPGCVIVDEGTALEPDLCVVPGLAQPTVVPWKEHPAPLLVVEILSASSRSFDRNQKRDAYLRRGTAEYWLIDLDARTVTVVRPNEPDQLVTEVLHWHPAGAREAFTLDLAALFG